MLEVVSFVLGPVMTNAYLIADPETGEAAVIDPAWDGGVILAEAGKRGWRIRHLWYTHAHFDHIGGAGEIADALNPPPLVALHPDDHKLWQVGGGAVLFGYRIDPGPEPTIDLEHGMRLHLGRYEFEVRHAPGHTPGHCIFYCADPYAGRDDGGGAGASAAGVLFSGDLIFQYSVGRTDLPGGDWDALVRSIRTQVYTLPDETRILSGHGPETTVGAEKRGNMFVSG